MAAKMKLYEFGPTRSIRARWTLQELGLEFEAIPVDLRAGAHRRPDFLKVNPAGKLPALVAGDYVLTESVAIVLYLAEKYPERGFVPQDLRERAEVYRWLLFAATELEQPLWRIARNRQLYPQERRQPGDLPNASEEFKSMAAVLARHLEGREFVATERATVADFVTAYTLDWGQETGLLDDQPSLVQYVEHMYARAAAPERIAEAFARINREAPG
jgi:glutathione S-transferase